MPDKKISELTELTTPAPDDELAIVDKDVTETKKITFDRIRANLQQGLDANKPEAGVDGRLYFATDTEILYRDNGATWEAILRKEQVIFTGICDYGFDHGITKYFWVGRTASDGYRYVCGVFPVAGKLKKLYVRMAWNDCNESSTLTLYKNEVATDLAITIPAGSDYTTITDTEHEVSVAVGDRFAFKVVAGGTSGAIGFAGISLVFVPD